MILECVESGTPIAPSIETLRFKISEFYAWLSFFIQFGG